jgi:hypothetical protein
MGVESLSLKRGDLQPSPVYMLGKNILKLCTACKAFTARAPEAVRRRVLIGIC